MSSKWALVEGSDPNSSNVSILSEHSEEDAARDGEENHDEEQVPVPSPTGDVSLARRTTEEAPVVRAENKNSVGHEEEQEDEDNPIETRAGLELKIKEKKEEMMAAGHARNFDVARQKQAELNDLEKLREHMPSAAELKAKIKELNEKTERCIEACEWDEAESLDKDVSRLKQRLELEIEAGAVEETEYVVDEAVAREIGEEQWGNALYDRLTVFQAEPLVWMDQEKNLYPFPHPPDFGLEKLTILDAVKHARKVGGEVDVIFKTATTNNLAACLEARDSEVLHISCHGDPNFLAIENEFGAMQVIQIEEWKEFVGAGRGKLKLVFVSSCFSGEVGKALHEAGVPHVVCCQTHEKLNDSAAIEFARNFYRALACKNNLLPAFEMAQAAVKVSPSVPHDQRFLLLPERPKHDPYHDVPVFYENSKARETRPSLTRAVSLSILPPQPKLFVGREIIMYKLLRDIRNSRFIQIIGPPGIGKSTLGKAACKYINDRKDAFLFEDVFWLPCLDHSYEGDDLSKTFREVLTAIEEESQSGDEISFKECCGKTARLLYERRSLIFIDTREMNSVRSVEKVRIFLEMLHQATTYTSVILICPPGRKLASKKISFDETVELIPLDMKSSVLLFGLKCPLVSGSAEDLVSLMVPESQGDATVVSKSMSKRCQDIFTIIGKGIPQDIITAAENMTKTEYKNLMRIGRRQEFQSKIDTHVALEQEVSRLSAALSSSAEMRDFQQAQEIKDTLGELENLRESLPPVAKLRVSEAELSKALDESTSYQDFAKASKIQRKLDKLRNRIKGEETAMLKVNETKRAYTHAIRDASSLPSKHDGTLSHVATYPIRANNGESADNKFMLVISHGSIVDFACSAGDQCAIVCGTNESCYPLPGGADGAVRQAGGDQLVEDVKKLPTVDENQWGAIRCPTGQARKVGPKAYGKLNVPYVIFAVGPIYANIDEGPSEILKADTQLRSAYQAGLELAMEARVEAVAFSLISAGNRAGAHHERTLRIALETVCGFDGYSELKEIHLCAYETFQCETLKTIANELGLGSSFLPSEKPLLAQDIAPQEAMTKKPMGFFERLGWKWSASPRTPDAHHPSTDTQSTPDFSSLEKYRIFPSKVGPSTSLFSLEIVQGSILDFNYSTQQAAIVCATNESCFPIPGAVDGAIGAAGGEKFKKDISKLPTLEENEWGGVRCPTGEARIIGPTRESYGKLKVPYVIFAVGPTYSTGDLEESKVEKDELLTSAYKASLELAKEARLEAVAFSLISAGNRAGGDYGRPLRIAVDAIARFGGYKELQKILLYGFTKSEADALNKAVRDAGLLPQGDEADDDDL